MKKLVSRLTIVAEDAAAISIMRFAEEHFDTAASLEIVTDVPYNKNAPRPNHEPKYRRKGPVMRKTVEGLTGVQSLLREFRKTPNDLVLPSRLAEMYKAEGRVPGSIWSGIATLIKHNQVAKEKGADGRSGYRLTAKGREEVEAKS